MNKCDYFSIGIVISTYNNPAWLEKTLWGYLFQTRPADEIIIADDGSDDRTRTLIDSFRDRLPIKHVWHEDQGQNPEQGSCGGCVRLSCVYGSGLYTPQGFHRSPCP
jgi:glycosyltransferase involved in cell wall biosynthesis